MAVHARRAWSTRARGLSATNATQACFSACGAQRELVKASTPSLALASRHSLDKIGSETCKPASLQALPAELLLVLALLLLLY